MGRAGEARAAYLAQLDLNPDHYKMHEGLRRASGLWVDPPAPATAAGGGAGEGSAATAAAAAVLAGDANAALSDAQRAELAALYRGLQEEGTAHQH